MRETRRKTSRRMWGIITKDKLKFEFVEMDELLKREGTVILKGSRFFFFHQHKLRRLHIKCHFTKLLLVEILA